jgi:hypothetical protein
MFRVRYLETWVQPRERIFSWKHFLENQFQKFLIAYNSVITWRNELGTQDQAAIQLASEKQTRNVYISI